MAQKKLVRQMRKFFFFLGLFLPTKATNFCAPLLNLVRPKGKKNFHFLAFFEKKLL
jgi:hypothetical protein